MKNVRRILLVIVVVVVVTIIYQYPKLNIISGYAAKNMASSVFIANRTASSITENDNNVPLIKLANSQIDQEQQQVSSSVFGLMERKAIYMDGLGCVLINETYDSNKPNLKPKRTKKVNNLPFPFGNMGVKDSIFENVDYELLHQAMDNVFSDQETEKTRTVLIVYKDHIIGEKYLNGFNKNTQILGWSMTKSVLATLYGILQHQGKINVDKAVPIDEWKHDERSAITLNNLLRMQSGLAWDEDYTAISDVTRMLFLDADMTQSQLHKKPIAEPKAIWNYSSGTSNLLSGVLRKQFKTHQEYLDFPYTSLIDKIGMHSMLLESDMEGNFVGSSYGWANTRDWAKFGLLYLHKGNWNGKQLFSPTWVDYVSKPTYDSEGKFGAHFWLNAFGRYPDVPKDLFFADGYQGQYVFIIPSKDLVVVRTGLTQGTEFDINGFIRDVIASIH